MSSSSDRSQDAAIVRNMVEDGIDPAVWVGTVDEPDAMVQRIAGTPLVCVGSRACFKERGTPTTPDELVGHNCLMYRGLSPSSHWSFAGPHGRVSVPVSGNLSSNSVETIRAAVLAGVSIGMFAGCRLPGNSAVRTWLRFFRSTSPTYGM
jgi:DNA-binding transcriptional LysR family regulator